MTTLHHPLMCAPSPGLARPPEGVRENLGTARRHVAQSGFTLIEMMISITIGLGILAGLVGVLATNSSNSKTNDRTAELLTNGRYALNSIRQELRQAGFRGYTWAEPRAPGALGLVAGDNECLEAGAAQGAFVSNLRQGIWGSNNANPFAATCIPAASYVANTDVLVVRRLDPVPVPAASLVANTLYFQSSYEVGQLFRSNVTPAVPPTFTGAPTPLASFAERIFVYYISPFTVAGEPQPVPALWRVALLANGSMTRELVASGIERMQLQYGRLTTALDTQYTDTVAGTSFNAGATDWDDVNAVRIWLLARNAVGEPGYVNTTTYVMGDQDITVNDNFRRQLFTSVIQLRN
jgi:type IV pilus assembly protein PilW